MESELAMPAPEPEATSSKGLYIRSLLQDRLKARDLQLAVQMPRLLTALRSRTLSASSMPSTATLNVSQNP